MYNIILILLSSFNSGYLHRFSKMGKKSGDTVYLIAAQWFRTWQKYTHYQMVQCPACLLHSGSVMSAFPSLLPLSFLSPSLLPLSFLSPLLSLPGDRSVSFSAHLKEGQEEDPESEACSRTTPSPHQHHCAGGGRRWEDGGEGRGSTGTHQRWYVCVCVCVKRGVRGKIFCHTCNCTDTVLPSPPHPPLLTPSTPHTLHTLHTLTPSHP